MKRYQIIVQHEVIVYGENERAAKSSLLHNAFLKDRTNVRCVSVTEIPMPGSEKSEGFIDVRKAPGA